MGLVEIRLSPILSWVGKENKKVYGVYGLTVKTTGCGPVNTGSIPVRHPLGEL